MSAICSVCNCECRESESLVKCNGPCEQSFHSECVKGDIEGKRTRFGKDWKCKECRGVLSSDHGSASSVGGTVISKEFLMRVFDSFKSQVMEELKSFREEMSEMTKSTNFVSDKLDTCNKLMSELKVELTAVKKENAELRAKNTVLENTMGELQDRVRSLEQYSRRTNIEVSGIPVTPRESVTEIVRDLGVALGVEVQESQVTAAHRIPSYKKDRVPSLVVQFSTKMVRDSWISKFKEQRGNLTAQNINKAYPTSKVYVNEHLSPENKLFLFNLKVKCREIGYAYTWCRDGKFFVRKANGEKCFKISKLSDMNNLK